MLVRLPFCAVMSALVFVTMVPHSRGDVLDDSIVRAAVGLVVGALLGLAFEMFRSRIAKRVPVAEQIVATPPPPHPGDAPRQH